MNVTMLTYPKNLEGSITILGEKGTVRVGRVAVNEIQHWAFEDSLPDDEQITNASSAKMVRRVLIYLFRQQSYWPSLKYFRSKWSGNGEL